MLGLVSADGRPVELRLIGYGDRTHTGAVHQAIAPLLEFAVPGARRRGRVLALVPVDFARERASTGMTLGGADHPLLLTAQEVQRLVAWVEGGDAMDAPLVVVCGDEWEIGRVVAILGRMPVELVRAARPAQAHAALGRRPALAVVAGTAPGLDRFVRAAQAGGVPLVAVASDEPALAAAGATRLPELDEQRLVAAVTELLDFV